MDAIINLTPVKVLCYEKVQEFYEKLSRNYDALQTLGEGDKLRGLVMTTINKLPQVKPDLVRSDDNWEEWSMEILISYLQKWLRRNKVEDSSKSGRKTEGNYYERESRKSRCIFVVWAYGAPAKTMPKSWVSEMQRQASYKPV